MKLTAAPIGWKTLMAVTLAACGGSNSDSPKPPKLDSVLDGGFPADSGPTVDGAACVVAPATEPGVVATKHGTVRGNAAGGTWAFRGVPFAAPPIGPLRWRAPVEPPCWTDVRDAAAFPPVCIQKDANDVKGAEDCLYLNVWTPTSAVPGSRPVLVFVHGGGNLSGSTSEMPVPNLPTYDGHGLAERGNVVVVTVQYRLNALGYFVHPALDAESSTGTSGNYGLMDQLAALRWVQDNIAAFGGDPRHVMVFGESGGAADVCALYASPLAAGLFQTALMQSGSCEAKTTAEVRQWSTETVARTSCATAADALGCLRVLDAASVVSAINATAVDPSGRVVTPAGPTIDGYVLPDSPHLLMSQGKQNHVPFIVGTNASETTSPIFRLPQTVSAAEYDAHVQNLFPTKATQVLVEYPLADYPSGRDALVAVTTDFQFTCPARRYARAAASHQSEPVYRYFYTQVMQGGAAQLAARGASHGLELYFVFQHLQALPSYTPSASDTALAATMLRYWTSAAAAGNPNAVGGSATWPAYDAATDPYVDLGTPVAAKAGVRTARCDFWDTL